MLSLPFWDDTNFNRWLPIMQAYEKGTGAYFATPPVNLIYAFNKSLTSITKGQVSLADRFQLHRDARLKIKEAAAKLGLKEVPLDPEFASNGMTAVSGYASFLTKLDFIWSVIPS